MAAWWTSVLANLLISFRLIGPPAAKLYWFTSSSHDHFHSEHRRAVRQRADHRLSPAGKRPRHAPGNSGGPRTTGPRIRPGDRRRTYPHRGQNHLRQPGESDRSHRRPPESRPGTRRARREERAGGYG